MARHGTLRLAILPLLGAFAIAGLVVSESSAQTQPPSRPPANALQHPEVPQTHSLGNNFTGQKAVENSTDASLGALLKTPLSHGIIPGADMPVPQIKNPEANNPEAVQKGMKYFTSFNCVGCHAANGGGGMGPALSNRYFKFGSKPADIYLDIAQGRPLGMPAWGSLLPSDVIWDLVAYIKSISHAPSHEWGTTISPTSPSIEEVPAEFLQTATPWKFTEPFSYGQEPEAKHKQQNR